MFLVAVVAVLILDAVLTALIWAIITCSWNIIIREELEVKSNLLWGRLLGIVVLIANAVSIAVMSPIQELSTFSSFVITLFLDAILIWATWFIIITIWNNVAKEKFRVRGNLAWARLLGIVLLIANTLVIAYLLQ